MATRDVLVSVAMATYNGGHYVQEQLDSLATQTRLPDELVISDDGSTDGTVEILESFRDRAPFRVKILHNANRRGVLGNFGNALEACTGKSIFLSDQDDVWFETKIEYMLKIASESPKALLFICDARFANRDLTQLGETKLQYVRRIRLSPNAGHQMGCCMLVRSELVRLATPMPVIPANHDNWLFLLAELIGQPVLIERPLQLYRRHGNNVANEPLASPVRSPYSQATGRLLKKSVERHYRDRKHVLAAAGQRFRERPSELAKVAAANPVDAILELVDIRTALAERREHLLMKKRVARLPHLFKMLIRGEYGHFAGWRSFVADAIAVKC